MGEGQKEIWGNSPGIRWDVQGNQLTPMLIKQGTAMLDALVKVLCITHYVVSKDKCLEMYHLS